MSEAPRRLACDPVCGRELTEEQSTLSAEVNGDRFLFCSAPTSFVLETDAELVGFLLGFLSQTHPEEAYVHFIGIAPNYRRLGLGRRLYERFFVAAQMHGRCWVRSITSPDNQLSIAFHRSLGFAPLHGDVVVDGVPVWFDYAGAGGHRVVFRRQIVPGRAPTMPGDGGDHGSSSKEGLDQVLAS